MSRIYCVDCGMAVVLDPSGRCPEGHLVELGDEPATHADPSTELAEPTGRLADVDLDALAADAARSDAAGQPPAPDTGASRGPGDAPSWADESEDVDDEPEPWVAFSPSPPAGEPTGPSAEDAPGSGAPDVAEPTASDPGGSTVASGGDEPAVTDDPPALDADFLAQLDGLDDPTGQAADRDVPDHSDSAPDGDTDPAPDDDTDPAPDGDTDPAPDGDTDPAPDGDEQRADPPEASGDDAYDQTVALFDLPAPQDTGHQPEPDAEHAADELTTDELETTGVVNTAPRPRESAIDPTNFTASGARVVPGDGRRAGLLARIGGRRVS